MNNWNFFIVFNLRDIDVKVEIKEINWSKTFFEIRRGRYVSLLSGNFTLRINSDYFLPRFKVTWKTAWLKPIDSTED